MNTLSPSFLKPVGEVLLLGSLGISLVQVTRGRHGMTEAIESVLIGLLALRFFDTALTGLASVSQELTETLSNLSQGQSIQSFVLESLEQAADLPSETNSSNTNIPEVLAQMWRIGVWGVMNSLIEGTFLIVFQVLEAAQKVLWALILTFSPIAAGTYPVSPRILLNLFTYSLELSLWLPTLEIIDFTAAQVARLEVKNQQSAGVLLIAIEAVTILLILSVPTIVHRFLAGAFSGDLDAQSRLFSWARQLSFNLKPKGGRS